MGLAVCANWDYLNVTILVRLKNPIILQNFTLSGTLSSYSPYYSDITICIHIKYCILNIIYTNKVVVMAQ